MFALCGVMIVVGVAYILVAPKGPSESASAVKPPTTRLAAAVAPAAKPADGPSGGGNDRSPARDTPVSEAGVGSVVTITTTTTPPAPPTTIPRVTIPAPTTTVVDPITIAATAAEALVRTVDTVLSVTLSAAVPTTVAPAPAVARVSANNDAGVASWFNAPDRTCAHRTLPFGTMVTVTRPATGAVTSCTVDDRGPTVETGRLIDLSMDTFAELASTSSGLIDVTIEW
jgi:hypothetical protein